MKSSRRPRLTLREIAILAGMGFAAIAIVAILVGVNIRVSSLVLRGGSFYAPWSAARAFLLQDGDPYGTAVAARAQRLNYGRLATAGENPYLFDSPFFLLPLYLPLALISEATAARAAWMFLSQTAATGTVFLSLFAIQWRPPRGFAVLFSLMVLSSLYGVAALVEGTPAILLGFAYVAILRAIQSGRDELAGGLIALCLFKWEVGLVFLVLVMWRIFHEGRWRILAGLGMTIVILLAVSFLLYPGWIMPYLVATMGMLRSPHSLSTSEVLLRLSPGHGAQIAHGLTAVILGVLIIEWAVARDSDFRRFIWLTCLALAITPLIGLGTSISNLVVVFPSLILVASASLQRRPPGSWLGILLLALAFVAPWAFFARWFFLDDQSARDLLLLTLPCIALAGLYWTRWWFIRPQRTWLDEIRQARHEP